MSHNFQVNLKQIIDLLSNHLYSGPEVYVRELLQNSIDAITARKQIDPVFSGKITFDCIEVDGQPPVLMCEDDGIGLSESEIHTFLSTIGQSTKREIFDPSHPGFIGQFGIGLLSCFLVSDDIVLTTKKLGDDNNGFEWRGNADGTYEVRHLDNKARPGTKVFLRAKPGYEQYFSARKVQGLLKHYGQLLPVPIFIQFGNLSQQVNDVTPPWRDHSLSPSEQNTSLMAFGESYFGSKFLDCIPLSKEKDGAEGAIYILPHAMNFQSRQSHCVFLKGMLLTQTADNILPKWAMFVRAIISTESLRPTASREAFYEDDALKQLRHSLGARVREYLLALSESRPVQLQKIMEIHHLPIKQLCIDDLDCYAIFYRWIPIETSVGWMRIGEYLDETNRVTLTYSRDEFKRLSPLVNAQGKKLINAVYINDHEILTQLPTVRPDVTIDELSTLKWSDTLTGLTAHENAELVPFLRAVDTILQHYKCTIELKRFSPAEQPTLFAPSSSGLLLRDYENSKQVANAAWASVLDSVAQRHIPSHYSTLIFNLNNALIQQLLTIPRDRLVSIVRMLYFQSLLIGHFPLSITELKELNEVTLEIIAWGLPKVLN